MTVALVGSFGTAYAAATDSDAVAAAPSADFSKTDLVKAEADISKLEEKFFQHTYAKDTWQVRLDRVEKMVFGAPKTGSSQERLTALLTAVPNLPSPETADKTATKTAQSDGDSSKPAKSRHSRSSSTASSPASSTSESQATADNDSEPSPGAYPAVTAIEKKVFGKDYASEGVNQRLGRLETNLFGKPSSSNDLSERVDRLKQKTGVDIAKQSPSGSDWSDDDEGTKTSFGMPSRRSYSAAQPSASSDDELDSDTAQGGYGFGGSSMASSSMGAGFASPSSSRHRAASTPASIDSIGLDQQVAALEREIFGKTYGHDPLAARLNRLETTVFSQKKPSVDLPLPDRVKNLLAVIPISQKNLPGHKHVNSDGDDLDLADSNTGYGSTYGAGQTPHGLSKIINSLSSMMGAGSMTGGYPVQNGSYVTDPKTGFIVDTISGNEINPATGTVVGHVAPSYGSGLGSYNSFGSFGNGFSPFGSPSMGSPYGGGMGSGLRFGVGGAGGRYGGF